MPALQPPSSRRKRLCSSSRVLLRSAESVVRRRHAGSKRVLDWRQLASVLGGRATGRERGPLLLGRSRGGAGCAGRRANSRKCRLRRATGCESASARNRKARDRPAWSPAVACNGAGYLCDSNDPEDSAARTAAGFGHALIAPAGKPWFSAAHRIWISLARPDGVRFPVAYLRLPQRASVCVM